MPRAKNKTQPTRASVKDFLAGVDNARRRQDAQVVLKILLRNFKPATKRVFNSRDAASPAR